MRVLYFHQHFGTPRGAGGTRSYEMAQRLIAHGHQVTMVSGASERSATGLEGPYKNGKRSGNVDGIDVIELQVPYSNSDGFLKRTWLFLLFALRSAKIALTESYDVVFATTTPLTAGIPGIAARWLRRKPFVFEVRDLWPELPKQMGVITNPVILWLMGVLEWASYKSAHRLIGLAPGIVEGIKRRGIADERVILIPNGCDIFLFQSDAIEAWRPAEVEKDDFLAIFAGAHGMANGLDAVLDAAGVLLERGYSSIRVILIGSGMLKQELMGRASVEGLSNVIFMDPIPKTQLAGLFKGADIGLQLLANIPAFYYGTSPNKFFDYIASGLPVLNNYPGWLAGMIEQHGCGYAVPPDDPEAFAQALIHASENKETLTRMGQKGQALAQAEFNRDVLGDRFVTWLEQAAQV